MNARKDRLKSLFAGEDPAAAQADAPAPAANAPAAQPAAPVQRTSSAAVKAMGLSLGALSREADEGRRLREAVAAGEQVIEIDPAFIERSPFIDRLTDGARDDPEFETLKQSLAEHGQQVPVLLRPHADAARAAQGFYQIAYGHRRVAAARELGRKVRAIVRALDDAALALAQGKENAERRGLSFVERSFFARTLIDHGFDRSTVQSALAVHKSEMSRLLQVAETVPLNVAQAIGPAPRVGRPRWVELGELIAGDRAGLANDEMGLVAFRAADTDTRFQRLFDRLKAAADRRKAKVQPKPERIADGQGRALAEFSRVGRAARITISAGAGEGFAAYVAKRLPDLHAAFLQSEAADET